MILLYQSKIQSGVIEWTWVRFKVFVWQCDLTMMVVHDFHIACLGVDVRCFLSI